MQAVRKVSRCQWSDIILVDGIEHGAIQILSISDDVASMWADLLRVSKYHGARPWNFLLADGTEHGEVQSIWMMWHTCGGRPAHDVEVPWCQTEEFLVGRWH